jgi:cell wall-associated NlpC family hydrolase
MKILYDYAMSFLGLPYLWGGDDPIKGFDCSGFVQELLISAGAHPEPSKDLTAQGLYDALQHKGIWSVYTCGALAFYGKDALHIVHVAMLLDQYRIIEAGGGGSTTLDQDVAARQNAFIRIRHVNRRKDLIAVIRPPYVSIGMVN